MARLEGKTALVVGAGSVGDGTPAEGWGNGKATAVLFAREGARVFAADLDERAAARTAALINDESGGGEAVAFRADALSAVSVADMVAACVDRFGTIDILQNNVGGSVPGGPVELDEADWDAAIAFNLKPAFLTCKHVLPVMEKQGRGAIVNVGSVAGIRGMGREMASYQASKGGLIQLTRAIALQYAARGIRANTVLPGLMNTPLVAHRIADQYSGGDREATVRGRDAVCPTGKMGDAWDVAYASLFLASDEAKYVTATELIVDGGLTARCVV